MHNTDPRELPEHLRRIFLRELLTYLARVGPATVTQMLDTLSTVETHRSLYERLIDRMVRDGIVDRGENPERTLSITDAGRGLAKEMKIPEGMPRSLTPNQGRGIFLRQIAFLMKYWLDLEGKTTRERMSGFMFSVLNVIDGSEDGIPGFKLFPSVNAQDVNYHRERGEDWFNSRRPINERSMLHEFWHAVEHEVLGERSVAGAPVSVPLGTIVRKHGESASYVVCGDHNGIPIVAKTQNIANPTEWYLPDEKPVNLKDVERGTIANHRGTASVRYIVDSNHGDSLTGVQVRMIENPVEWVYLKYQLWYDLIPPQEERER